MLYRQIQRALLPVDRVKLLVALAGIEKRTIRVGAPGKLLRDFLKALGHGFPAATVSGRAISLPQKVVLLLGREIEILVALGSQTRARCKEETQGQDKGGQKSGTTTCHYFSFLASSTRVWSRFKASTGVRSRSEEHTSELQS